MNSVTVPKSLKEGPFGIFQYPFCCKISKITKADPLMQSKNFRKVSVTKKFNLKREPMGRSLVCSRASGRRFCFGRSFDVSSMFWTSVVQVEQMDKKVDPRHLKKITHCKSRTPSKAPNKFSGVGKNFRLLMQSCCFFSTDLFMKISNFSKTVHTIFIKFCTVILHPKGPLRVQWHQNRMTGL